MTRAVLRAVRFAGRVAACVSAQLDVLEAVLADAVNARVCALCDAPGSVRDGLVCDDCRARWTTGGVA